MLNYDTLKEHEDVTPNKHPVATGISMLTIVVFTIAFACLAVANSGCTSPPDTQCAEMDPCGGDDDDTDGSTPDQTDGGGNCATNGTCPDAGSDTDAPSGATCTAIAWMENPEMFNCDFFELDGTVYTAHSCDPELLPVTGGCSIKCGPFWAAPNQLTMDIPNHSFDWYDTPDRPYPTYRCVQRQD